MKKTIALLLGLLLISSLTLGILSGCGPTEPTASQRETAAPAETAAETEGSQALTVSTVDELLAAIAPGAQITLAPGTYDLSTAESYRRADTGSHYRWSSDGGLTLTNLQGLTIRGAGADLTEIVTQSTTADVLALTGCANVTVSGLRLGHVQMPDACSGDVIGMDGCEDITLEGLELYGCGVQGLDFGQCKNITVKDCEIFQCSRCALGAEHCRGITLEGCTIRDLGGENGGSEIFWLDNCDDVTLADSTVVDNYVGRLCYLTCSSSVTIRDTLVTRNRFIGEVFDLCDTDLTLIDSRLEHNTKHGWYASYSGPVLNGRGEPYVFEEEPEESTAPVQPAEAIPVSTGKQKQVRVKTVDEFLNALANDTEIILDAPLFDLSTATGYGESEGEHYYWDDPFDGPSLVLYGLENFTLRAEGELLDHVISAVPRYAHVLTFDNCANITVTGFTAGHTREPGSCIGGVLDFRSCESVLVENCGLYGCGVIGVWCENSLDVQILNNDIYECSNHGIQLDLSESIVIGGNRFRDLGGTTFSFYGSKNITVDGKSVDGNYSGF